VYLQSYVIHYRRVRGNGSVNCTLAPVLSTMPVVLPIEVKGIGESLDQTHTRAGVWLLAHWRMLQAQLSDDNRAALYKLPFLPALIIQEHEWYFVALTSDADRKVLWYRVNVGNTRDPVGVYKIIKVIRLLANWVETVYEPWYSSWILEAPRFPKPEEDSSTQGQDSDDDSDGDSDSYGNIYPYSDDNA
jgi:hypothetical protein